MKIAILIPVIRPDRLQDLTYAIHEIGTHHPGCMYQIFALEDVGRIGCPKMVNKLVAKAKGTDNFDAFMFLGDDVIPHEGFIDEAIKELLKFPDGWGVVGLKDVNNTGTKATHFLVHEKALKTFLKGDFFHEGYKHCFCDDELIHVATQNSRYRFAEKAMISHDHPGLKPGKGTWLDKIRESGDADLVRAYSTYNEDRKLFRKRIRAFDSNKYKGFTRVAICIPSGHEVFTGFAIRLAHLVSTCVPNRVIPTIINHQGSLLAFNRQVLVESALNCGAEYIMFLDTDMIFPAHSLFALLRHNVDFVCADASRKKPPFNTVVTGLDEMPLYHKNNTETLVEIKGISPAVCLIKTEVFDKIDAPYFNTPFENGKFTGEDRYFGYKIQDAGFKCYCDMELSKQIGHIGTKEFYINA